MLTAFWQRGIGREGLWLLCHNREKIYFLRIFVLLLTPLYSLQIALLMWELQ